MPDLERPQHGPPHRPQRAFGFPGLTAFLTELFGHKSGFEVSELVGPGHPARKCFPAHVWALHRTQKALECSFGNGLQGFWRKSEIRMRSLEGSAEMRVRGGKNERLRTVSGGESGDR